MFGWGRRSEGFEWREYVRTTILVRRADRQRKLDDARMAALAKVKDARDRGVEAGRASVSRAGSGLSHLVAIIFQAIIDGIVAVAKGTARWAAFIGAVIFDAVRSIVGPAADKLRDQFASIRLPEIRLPVIERRPRNEEPAKKRAPAGNSGAARESVREKLRFAPDVARQLPIKGKHVLAAAATIAAIYFGGPILRSADGLAITTGSIGVESGYGTRPASNSAESSGSSSDIRGRATALAGNLLRVDGILIKLDGIEPPAAGQTCGRSKGRGSTCAAITRSALSRLVRGATVNCAPTSEDDAGNLLANCTVRDLDINAELVRSGNAFAISGIFSKYTADEAAAREAKAGIWARGDIERPQEWRDRTWNEAKRDAPDGCPIKGVVRSSSKTYALPWESGYARAKVRIDRGGRWFCSEDEARSAGFQPAADRS